MFVRLFVCLLACLYVCRYVGIYVWRVCLVHMSGVYVWRVCLVRMSGVHAWHACLVCIFSWVYASFHTNKIHPAGPQPNLLTIWASARRDKSQLVPMATQPKHMIWKVSGPWFCWHSWQNKGGEDTLASVREAPDMIPISCADTSAARWTSIVSAITIALPEDWPHGLEG